jgi:hypothetical protein
MVKFKEESIQTLLGAFAGMSENYVHALSTDSAGSRALEAFLASATVPQKAKFRLVDRVTGKRLVLRREQKKIWNFLGPMCPTLEPRLRPDFVMIACPGLEHVTLQVCTTTPWDLRAREPPYLQTRASVREHEHAAKN